MRVPAIIMPRFESLLQCSGAMQISLSVPLPATSTPSATPCCHCHSTFSRRPLIASKLAGWATWQECDCPERGGPMVLVPCNRAGCRAIARVYVGLTTSITLHLDAVGSPAPAVLGIQSSGGGHPIGDQMDAPDIQSQTTFASSSPS
jgi:hypothetical protein